jgi:Arrestin (or S-antigen), C-terminal domain
VSATRPLRITTSKHLFMGGTGKVTLTASLHRLHWIAGQQCCVKVNVTNATKKAIKCLTLTLVRSTIVFKPDARLDALNDMDPDACQTSTTHKVVAESVLELGQRGARGHASAKGWWTGVCPGENMEFFHFIPLPV